MSVQKCGDNVYLLYRPFQLGKYSVSTTPISQLDLGTCFDFIYSVILSGNPRRRLGEDSQIEIMNVHAHIKLSRI